MDARSLIILACFWERIHNTSLSSQVTNISNKLECYIKLSSDKQSNLLDPFVSYEENNVFVNTSPGVYIKIVYGNH